MTRRAWRLLAVLVVCVLLAPLCRAQGFTWDAVVPNGASIENASGGMRYDFRNLGATAAPEAVGSVFQGRTFGTPAGGATRAAAAFVSETYRIPGAPGGALTVVATRALPWLAIANSAALLYGAWSTGFAIGTAINDAVGDSRLFPRADGWVLDPGADPSQHLGPCWKPPDVASECFSQPQPAAQFEANLDARGGAYPIKWTVDSCAVSGSSATCQINCLQVQYGACGSRTLVVANSPRMSSSCEASFDALDPRYNVPAGAPPGPDGKCRTGRYNPIGVADAARRLSDWGSDPATTPQVPKDLIRDILDKGQPISGAQPGGIAGPDSVTGSPTTTTTTPPNGAPVTTTATPSWNYTYSPSTITITQTTTTVNNNGTTITTGPAEPAKPAEQKTDCDKKPNSVGCSDLGAPDNTKPTWTEKPMTYTPVDMPGGSCPPDRNFAFHGWLLPLHWQPACDAAPVVKVGVLLCATLMAAVFIVRTVTQ